MAEDDSLNKEKLSATQSSAAQKTDRMDLFSNEATQSAKQQPQGPVKHTPVNNGLFSKNNRFFGKLSRGKIIAGSVFSLMIILAMSAIFISKVANKHNTEANQKDIKSAALNDNNLLGLSDAYPGQVNGANVVAINSPMRVNNSLTVTPSDRPQNAQAGQLYFDKTLKRFMFFDGITHRTVATGQQTDELRTITQEQQNQSTELSEDINQLRAQVLQTQALQNAATADYVAGAGIDITENTITNTGVIALQGTPNQVFVSASTGSITISLPQDINIGASPTFAGLQLTSPLGITSGGTGATISDLTSGGIVYYNGTRMVTSEAAAGVDYCFVSGLTGPKFVPCGTLDFGGVSSLNNLEGNLTIANASTNGKVITINDASQSQSGIVNSVNQRFGGLKTFTGGIELGLSAGISGQGGISIQPANFSSLVLGNNTGNIKLLGVDCTSSGNGGKLTLDGNGVVICASDTGGDGVGLTSIAAGDPSITVDNTDGDNPKVSVNAKSGGGLVTTSSGLGLIDYCGDGQTLKYNGTTTTWQCANDNDSISPNDCPSCVALQDSTPGDAQTGHMNITGTMRSGEVISGKALFKSSENINNAFDLQDVSGSSLINGNTENMKVTIGSLSSPSTSELSDSLPTGSTNYFSTGSYNMQDVAVSGKYAYLITQSSYMYVVDVSDLDSSPTQVYAGSATLTSPVKALANGNYLYVLDNTSTSYGTLRVFNISNPASPTLVLSRNDIGRTPVDMVKQGNYLYVINQNSSSFNNSKIYVYEVSDAGNPTQVNTQDIPGPTIWPTAIDAQGTNLYVTDRSSGGTSQLYSFDISNPLSISQTGSVGTNAGPTDVSVRDNRAYVINQTAATLQTFDVSNPAAMSLVNTSQPGDIYSNPSAVTALPGKLYVATYYNGGDNKYGYFQMFSTSNPNAPSLVGSIPLVSRATNMMVKDGIVYISATYPSRNNMQVIRVGGDIVTLQVNGNSMLGGSLDVDGNISAGNGTFTGNVSASNITALSAIQAQNLDAMIQGSALNIGSAKANAINLNQNTSIAAGKTLSVAGSTLITTDSSAALQVKDSSDNNLLLVDASGMNIDIGSSNAPTTNIDVGGSIPSSGASGSVNISSLPNSVVVSGNYAYVASSILNKLQVVDVSKPSSPTVVGSVTTSGDARDIAYDNNRVYLALNSGVVEVYNVSNPASPTLTGSYTTQNAVATMQSIIAKNNYIYITYVASAANAYGYLDTVDMSNPGAPIFRSVKTLGSNSKELRTTIEGNRLFIITEGTTTNSGLRIVDISNPTLAILPMTNHNMLSTKPSGGVAAKGNYVYIPFNNDSTIKIYDVSGITGSGTLTPVNSISSTNGISDIIISESGKYMYLTDETANQLQIYNLSDPVYPQVLGSVDVSTGNSSAKTVAVASANGSAYVVNNSRSNLVVVDLNGSAPRISFNQNTELLAGRTFTTQGVTTVKADSDNALRVQNAAGEDVLVVDTNSGTVIARTAFAVGNHVGLDIVCDVDQSLNNIVITGGIVTGGTCGDGTGGGGSGSQLQFGEDGGILSPSLDTKLVNETLNIGPNNADSINLNQDTTLASGKTLTVQGNTTLAADSDKTLTVTDSANTVYLVVDTQNGSVKIGAPKASPEPTPDEPVAGFTMPSGYSGRATLSGQPYDMATKGSIAYVSLNYDNKVVAYDISGATPSLIGTVTLTKPERMSISGNYLYVLTDDQIYVVDISTPATPTLVQTTSKFSALGLYEAIATNNTTLYVVTDSRQILAFNITTPTLTTLMSSRSNALNNLASVYSIADSGGNFFAVDNGSNLLRVFSGTNSINPIGSVVTNTKPVDVAISGNYAYVVSSPSNIAPGKMEVFDISTPATPVKKAEIATGNWPQDIKISYDGSFATIINYNTVNVQVVDITNPLNPLLVGFAPVGTGPLAAGATNDKAVVASMSNRYLETFAIDPYVAPPPADPEPEFGITLNSNTISTSGSIVRLQGDTAVRTDSKNAFTVQEADGTKTLIVDTVDGKIIANGEIQADELTVSGAASLASLTVSSDATFLANILVNGHVITGGSTPTAVALANLGIGATCTVSGNDTSGAITIVGGSSASPGSVCDITFSTPFAKPPKTVLSSSGQSGALLDAYTEASTTKITLGVSNATTQSDTYVFNYWNPQ